MPSRNSSVWLRADGLPFQLHQRLDDQLQAAEQRFRPPPRSESPAGGTLYEVPIDPVTSGKTEAGVFVYMQACAAGSGRKSVSVDEAWTGS